MPTLCARSCVCTRRSAHMEASHILVTFHVRNIENRDRITKKKIAAFSNAFFVWSEIQIFYIKKLQIFSFISLAHSYPTTIHLFRIQPHLAAFILYFLSLMPCHSLAPCIAELLLNRPHDRLESFYPLLPLCWFVCVFVSVYVWEWCAALRCITHTHRATRHHAGERATRDTNVERDDLSRFYIPLELNVFIVCVFCSFFFAFLYGNIFLHSPHPHSCWHITSDAYGERAPPLDHHSFYHSECSSIIRSLLLVCWLVVVHTIFLVCLSFFLFCVNIFFCSSCHYAGECEMYTELSISLSLSLSFGYYYIFFFCLLD